MERYFAASFGFLLGLTGLYVSFTQLRNFTHLRSWKATRGKIEERGTIQSKIGNVRNAGIRFCPFVRYSYQVDRQDYSNDSIYPTHMQAPPSGSIEWAEREANSFENEITIFYDPGKPQNSSLRMPSRSTYYIIAGASVIVVLYSIFVLVFGVDNYVGIFNR